MPKMKSSKLQEKEVKGKINGKKEGKVTYT
jgi:hypothetical protein